MAGCCECGNEQSDTIRRGEFLDQLRNCQLLREDADGKLHCTLNTAVICLSVCIKVFSKRFYLRHISANIAKDVCLNAYRPCRKVPVAATRVGFNRRPNVSTGFSAKFQYKF
jgi:hypothetical protein